MRTFVCLLNLLCASAPVAADSPTPKPSEPKVAAASDEAQKAIAGFRLPNGMRAELVAAEPMVANPAAFCFDEQGRIYVAETFRQSKGVEDNRSHGAWLDDDLAAQTVADRLAYFRKHLKDRINEYTQQDDRIRLLEDKDGDGKMDTATVFADGFNGILEGTGAGVLARGKDVYYTCIPNLWLLRDTDGDGKADQRKSLVEGFGVRVAFRGHDLHGLCFGPDGKLYFSIGDRGFNVTAEGKKFAYPDRGGVFRCNPDGTEFEVVALGLRNPQELAFDAYGNLFTGDNNSDSGDQARWVYVVEGGDSGWRMYYQYLNDRGPFNREKIWHVQHEGQPAYIVPPIANVASGPAGLTYYPGVGLPEKYQGHFFLCDFHGGPKGSGVLSFAMKPKGASFELIDQHEFIGTVLATDVGFGPDCSIYVSDWVNGWNGDGKGRIYRFVDPQSAAAPLVAQTRQLIQTGMSGRPAAELVKLLAHADMRVRQAAQFALAEQGAEAIQSLAEVAKGNGNLLARLHAIWGLGQIGRKLPLAFEPVLPLLADSEAEVRSQSAKVLGDARWSAAADRLLPLLADDSSRVRFFASMAVGKIGDKKAMVPILEMLRANQDQDAYLRHAGVMALAGIKDEPLLLAAAGDNSSAVRMGVLLALRRLESAEVARFLNDPEARNVDEAARAINDVPIEAAMPHLAAMIGRSGLSEASWRRVLNANYVLGAAENASAVAHVIARNDVPEPLRVEALNTLLVWCKPASRDRVTGRWRPLEPRGENIAVEALRPELASILTSSDRIRPLALQLAAKLGIREIGPALYQLLADKKRGPSFRADALRALIQLKDPRAAEALQLALTDGEPVVRAEAGRQLAKSQPNQAIELFDKVLAGESILEQQSALSALGEMPGDKAEAVLEIWLDQLSAGKVRPELQLDVLIAAGRRTGELAKKLKSHEASRSAADPLSPYRETLAGGDAERGRRLFFEKSEVSCVRCHKVQSVGGDVGPDLTKVGAEKDRQYLLESIVLPNKAIAKLFDSATLALDDGKVVSGVVKGEDDRELRLVTPEGKLLTIAKSTIESRSGSKSPMPEDLVKKLSKSELRDLVEYLATRTGP